MWMDIPKLAHRHQIGIKGQNIVRSYALYKLTVMMELVFGYFKGNGVLVVFGFFPQMEHSHMQMLRRGRGIFKDRHLNGSFYSLSACNHFNSASPEIVSRSSENIREEKFLFRM